MGRLVVRSGGTTYTWKHRTAVVIDCGTLPVGSNEDVTFTVPTNWDFFWNNVGQSDGDDVVLTTADGETIATFQHASAFSTSTRNCVLQADGVATNTAGANGQVLWLYWGNTTVASQAGSFAYSASKTAYVLTSSYDRDIRFVWAREPNDSNKARPRMQKTAAEVVLVAIDYRSVLSKRRTPYGGGVEDEEPSYFAYAVYSATSAQAAMIDATAIRADNQYVYVIVRAGTTGTEYTGRVTMTTTSKSNTGLARTLEFSFTIRVKNPTEA